MLRSRARDFDPSPAAKAQAKQRLMAALTEPAADQRPRAGRWRPHSRRRPRLPADAVTELLPQVRDASGDAPADRSPLDRAPVGRARPAEVIRLDAGPRQRGGPSRPDVERARASVGRPAGRGRAVAARTGRHSRKSRPAGRAGRAARLGRPRPLRPLHPGRFGGAADGHGAGRCAASWPAGTRCPARGCTGSSGWPSRPGWP